MADRPSIDDLARVRGKILALAARHGARNVRVFGSVARGEADAASDIDFLVDFEPGRSLLDLAALLVDLEDLLGHPVDVVTEPGLKARIRQRVLAEAVPV
ncbi:MAG TPA: nucleotidyltransferase family protein [Actinomycetes bacterium]|nr:nucleotidyltransferase family protein [Actinomycetes bacterium]